LVEVLVLFIFKKNGSLRLCVNYRDVNYIIIKNRYSLLLLSNILNRLFNIFIFFKLDFRDIYYRIKIKKSDR
jgi:hypothetical protein